MPKLQGLYDCMPEIEFVTVEMVQQQVSDKLDLTSVENRMGNLLLYPQVIPANEYEEKLELMIVEQAIRIDPVKYYKESSHKMYLPGNCFARFPSLSKLVMVFIDALNPLGMVTIIERSPDLIERTLGTLLRPGKVVKGALATMSINGTSYEIKEGEVKRFPVIAAKVDIRFSAQGVQLTGQSNITGEVSGGQVGIIVDLRNRGKP